MQGGAAKDSQDSDFTSSHGDLMRFDEMVSWVFKLTFDLVNYGLWIYIYIDIDISIFKYWA